MSHRIETHDKQQGLTMAWHGLTEIKPDLSLENNWLNDWDIKPTPLHTITRNEDFGIGAGAVTGAHDTGFSILQATDDPSLTIGVPFNPQSYRPITNAEFLKLLKDSTEGIEGMRLNSVGSIRNRGRVFASFSTEALDTYKAGGRTFLPYLNFGNGHDKSSVLWTNTSNTCTVCDNTFQMNLGQVEEKIGNSSRVRHTKNVVAKLDDLALIIRMANQAQINFAMAFEKLAEVKVEDKDAEAIFVGFIHNTDASEAESKTLSTRVTNIVARLMDLFRTGKGNKGQTLADMFSAITDYYTHENAGNGSAPWKQFTSSEFGSGAATKQRFFDLVTNDVNYDRTHQLFLKGRNLLENSSK